jgi:hypothetical protein
MGQNFQRSFPPDQLSLDLVLEVALKGPRYFGCSMEEQHILHQIRMQIC